MLEVLTQGFRVARQRLRGETEITDANIEVALRDLRRALLEGDVALEVAKRFLARVKEEALGQVVRLKAGKGSDAVRVTAGDHFTRICQEQLTALMGTGDTALALTASSRKPAVLLLVGLQGSGKTTTAAKLARNLKEQGRKPLLVAADVYRPAAIDQLVVLGERIGVPVYRDADQDAVKICKAGVAAAIQQGRDVVILDTAGRLVVDEPLMRELDKIANATRPSETLLVCDAMIGQEAVTTATAFHARLTLTGAVLTKLDGDARGGAALSIREATGVPIKLAGMGEGLDRLEPFRADALASRILGMGDVDGLMADFSRAVDDEQQAEEAAKKALAGELNFEIFLDQLQTLSRMGSLSDLVAKLPFFADSPLPAGPIDDTELKRAKVLIHSMTPAERRKPSLLERSPSRRKRICQGAGLSAKALKELMKKLEMMRQMMALMGTQAAGGGLMAKVPGLRRLSQVNSMRTLDPSALAAPPLGGGRAGRPAPALPLGLPAAPNGPRPKIDRTKQKAKRKAQRQARKRGKR
ncbi:MAG: signal recognition particle protein [Nitrospirae bacterium CG18_big_fil_WC_8_21_14_2_50_70_55]|nr:signal recognition particle protein [Deltaproteobacteria bacterium]OIP63779.1 MAG: signal recognition particle protein [Nitrospirae bacterium CG2_30_70_394]PIQ03061.1 MAG: signal recognition particle protein [Nitrospirae bacterium CG18_big_fil_WC_8_21_14_2_50_70_55]PIU77870.1 MAG: signal recognition particle protein [Nitrospirae bacterium CG06_land_8_20_14_3_00_70_43]PIW83561.1 MAG: signal recognition particle protein [Nitrospirae bacterium CG_4_8_14_3_um_filter_70_85]PIX84122.1 MAG: signal